MRCSKIITCTTTATSSSVFVGALQQDHHLHDNSHDTISLCWCTAATSSSARQQPRHHMSLVHCSNIITCTTTATSPSVVGALQQHHHLHDNSHVIICRWCTAATSSPARQQPRHHLSLVHCSNIITCTTIATSSLVFVNSHVIIRRWCTASTSSPAQQPRHHQSLLKATSSSVVGALQHDHHCTSHIAAASSPSQHRSSSLWQNGHQQNNCHLTAAKSLPAKQQLQKPQLGRFEAKQKVSNKKYPCVGIKPSLSSGIGNDSKEKLKNLGGGGGGGSGGMPLPPPD